MSALAADTALRRAVLALADGSAELWHHTITPWQSITFTGERHRFCLKLKDQVQIDTVVERLDRLELRGSLLADAQMLELRNGDGCAWLTMDLLLLFET